MINLDATQPVTLVLKAQEVFEILEALRKRPLENALEAYTQINTQLEGQFGKKKKCPPQ